MKNDVLLYTHAIGLSTHPNIHSVLRLDYLNNHKIMLEIVKIIHKDHCAVSALPSLGFG